MIRASIQRMVAPVLDYLGVVRQGRNGGIHGGTCSMTGVPPNRAHRDDAGYDVISPRDFTIPPGGIVKVDTGLRFSLPPHVWLCVHPRSGSAPRGIHTLAGVVDTGYTGNVHVVMSNMGTAPYIISAGDRIGQLVPTLRVDLDIRPVPANEFARLTIGASRGNSGFGSTGV